MRRDAPAAHLAIPSAPAAADERAEPAQYGMQHNM
jgi:hypothetical protein